MRSAQLVQYNSVNYKNQFLPRFFFKTGVARDAAEVLSRNEFVMLRGIPFTFARNHLTQFVSTLSTIPWD
ncbi:hypothetical protein SAMN05444065_109282 [Pseudomonas syringae]|uniref:Uncharacterized protein n=1 Tax=Pseudomonas syringae TaxID=317 RepID=A0AB38BVT2_PSESX|nr:hypothetical protein SAMN05444065_109282 [Pseudomonas syringae]SFO65988.1 hypothetical protein SAMN05444063_1146 [Pseudomonas syringae]